MLGQQPGWKKSLSFARNRALRKLEALTTETVQGTALALEGIDHIEGGDRLPASMLSVSHGVLDDPFEENLQDASALLIDQTRNALDTSTTSQSSDSGLRNTLDIVTQNLSVPLGASLTETFTAFAASRHTRERRAE